MSRTTLTDAQKWTIAGVAALVLVLVVAVLVVAGGDDADDGSATSTTSSTTTTTEATTTSAAPSSTTTTTFQPAVDPYAVAFPSPGTSRSFESPESAAQAYATDVLGFTELELGDTDQSTEEAADVVVKDRADGPETVVELRRFEDAWYAIGSTTPDVSVAQPTAGASLSTPFQTSGEALAFEGTVEVVVLAQDEPEPLGSGTVTGSGSPPPGPFSGSISYRPPPQPTPGVLVFRVRSPEDGRVVQATSIRVRLTGLSS